MSVSTQTHITLQTLDKGLRSHLLHEQMATIVNMVEFVRENPFPFFVNTAIVRLCEAFRDGSNAFRLCVVRVMGECSSVLRLVFSSEEVVRRVLKVSHSNDSLARALTLQLLAKLAPAIADNTHVHHLIVKSLDSEEARERAAAIMAMKAFVHVSKSFSQTVFNKLCITLISSGVPPAMKVRLVDVFANMLADIEITMKVFALGERILKEACSQQLSFALINSLTTLACTCRFAIPEQLSLLIDRLNFSKNNRHMSIVILRSITRLASTAHMFSDSHVHELCEFGNFILDPSVRISWLRALVRLTAQDVLKINKIINERSLRWGFLLSDSSRCVQLLSIHLFVNLFSRLPSPRLSSLIHCAFLARKDSLYEDEHEKFYQLLTMFVTSASCPSEVVHSLVNSLLTSVLPSSSIPYFLQFLVASAEIHFHLYANISKWAVTNMEKTTGFTEHTLYACLVYAPLERLDNLPLNHLKTWTQNPWMAYLVARTGLRNGHWNVVARPLLELIECEAETYQTRLWLSALKHISSAAVTEFTVTNLGVSLTHYNNAIISLNVLCAIRESERFFFFPKICTECFASFFDALKNILVVFNTTALLSANPPKDYICERVASQCRLFAKRVAGCRELWENLFMRCFDADLQTLTFIEYRAMECALLSSALLLFSESTPQVLSSFPSPLKSSFANCQLHDSLVWASGQFGKLANLSLEKRYSHENVRVFTKVLSCLVCRPICLPRFYFQQLRYTQIKMSISPQPSPCEAAVTVMSHQKIPISVEGIMECKDISKIETVIVMVSAKFGKNSSLDHSQSQSIELQSEKFFKAQFLLSFPQSCTLEFGADFIDQETKRRWKSGVVVELKVNVSDRS